MELWEACATQWRTNMGAYVGLDYPAVFKIAELMEIKMTHEFFMKIKSLERAFLLKQIPKG